MVAPSLSSCLHCIALLLCHCCVSSWLHCMWLWCHAIGGWCWAMVLSHRHCWWMVVMDLHCHLCCRVHHWWVLSSLCCHWVASLSVGGSGEVGCKGGCSPQGHKGWWQMMKPSLLVIWLPHHCQWHGPGFHVKERKRGWGWADSPDLDGDDVMHHHRIAYILWVPIHLLSGVAILLLLCTSFLSCCHGCGSLMIGGVLGAFMGGGDDWGRRVGIVDGVKIKHWQMSTLDLGMTEK